MENDYGMHYYTHLYNTKLKVLFLFLTCFTFANAAWGQQAKPVNIPRNAAQVPDSTKSQIAKDTTLTAKKQNSNQIDAEISYTATDSIVFLGDGTGFLYGKTNLKYKKIDLKEADYVRISADSSTIFARGVVDSVGVLKGKPIINDGEQEYAANELTYNLRTRKGFIRQAVTQQGEGYIISDKTKKTDDDVLCMENGKYTTCDDHDHPHFYLSLSKAKVKPGSYIVTGPAHMVLLDIPLPAVIPFGYFPFNKNYSSGLEMPSFDTDITRGYGLTNGGYYFAISDYADLSILGDVYTRGTWGVNLTSNYVKRYKFNGSVNLSYREDVIGEKDMPGYSKNPNLSIRWSHSQNPKVNPYRTLSASVNFTSSGWNRSNINSYYTTANADNTKSSTVSFSQRFPNNPFSISANMSVTQRTKDSTINLTLPNVSISMSRIFPLKRKNAIGKERWYEKISMSYSGTFANGIQTKENKLLKSSFAKDWTNSALHNIPVSASFNLLKYITLTPSFNYNEKWFLKSQKKIWDAANQKEVTTTIIGFNRVWDYNMSVSANTTLYGMYTPLKSIFGDKIEKFRHVVKPNVSFTYTPDFGADKYGYYDSYIKSVIQNGDPTKITSEQIYYSRFPSGAPGKGLSKSLSFSLDNNLEMKMKDNKDTTGLKPTKIVSLIDQFSLNSAYNFAADSMQLSNIGASLRIKFGKAYTLSLSGAFDPYMYSSPDGKTIRRVNQLRWNHGKFPRFLGTSTSYSYTISNETFKRKNKKKTDNTDANQDDASLKNQSGSGENMNNQNQGTNTNLQKAETDADGYEKVTIPWSLSVSYSVQFGNSNDFDYKKLEYKQVFTHNLSFSGDIKLTPGWQISGTTSYDFTAKKLSYTSFNITRNLHCWTLTGSMVPFGPYKTYSFRIGVNSSMLRDLKYDKQGNRSSPNKINWY